MVHHPAITDNADAKAQDILSNIGETRTEAGNQIIYFHQIILLKPAVDILRQNHD